MKKTILEKRIYERAEEKTKEEYSKFMSFLKTNEFASKLSICIKKGETINDEIYIPLSRFGCNYSLFNDECLKNKFSTDHTTLENVYNEILEENIRKETDNILRRLEDINYLFNE